MKEATARIKINGLFEKSGWRFFAEGNARANIRLEAFSFAAASPRIWGEVQFSS